MSRQRSPLVAFVSSCVTTGKAKRQRRRVTLPHQAGVMHMGRTNRREDVFKYIDMKPVYPSTCWLWTASVNSKGLAYFVVDKKRYSAPRLVYWLTHPEWDIDNTRELILHTCVDAEGRHVDNRTCCNPAHMRPGTSEENMIDMMLRARKGLTIDAIRGILDTVEKFPEFTHSQIAARVSHLCSIPVARQTVTDILNRRRRRVL